MTRSLPVFQAVASANELFKNTYSRNLKGALLAALVLTALFVWLWPGYEAEPYQLRQKEEMVWVDIPDPVVIEEPPVVVPRPVLPKELEIVTGDVPFEDELPFVDWGGFHAHREGPVVEPAEVPFVSSSTLPVCIQRAKADYPEIARRAGLEGTVVVNALVGVNGRVREAVVARGVHPLLDKAAVAATRKCRFEPGRQRTLKVATWVAVPYRFRLR